MLTTWEHFESSVQTVCAVVAALLNMLLLHLIINRSSSNFGLYKYLMIYIAVFEIVYAVVDALIIPSLYTKDSIYLIILYSHKTVLPQSLLPLFSWLYCATFGFSMAIFAMQFVFRYLAVCGNTSWTSKNPSTVCVWMICPLIIGMVWMAVCGVFCGPAPTTDAYLMENILRSNDSSIASVAYLGYYFYPVDPSGRVTVNWWNFTGIAVITLIMFVSSFIMLFFGRKCYLELEQLASNAAHSTRFRSIQSQLFVALVFQTVIPLVLMHVPCSLITLTCFVDSAMEGFGRVLSVTIAMFPALDPLPNMIIIKEYRVALIGYCTFFLSSVVKPLLKTSSTVPDGKSMIWPISSYQRKRGNHEMVFTNVGFFRWVLKVQRSSKRGTEYVNFEVFPELREMFSSVDARVLVSILNSDASKTKIQEFSGNVSEEAPFQKMNFTTKNAIVARGSGFLRSGCLRIQLEVRVDALIDEHGFRHWNYVDPTEHSFLFTNDEWLEPLYLDRPMLAFHSVFFRQYGEDSCVYSLDPRLFSMFSNLLYGTGFAPIDVDDINEYLLYAYSLQIANVTRFCERKLIEMEARQYSIAVVYGLNRYFKYLLDDLDDIEKLTTTLQDISFEYATAEIMKLLTMRFFSLV